MKKTSFNYCSDIHLEFRDVPVKDIPHGDNLILAGDIITIPMLDSTRVGVRTRVLNFFENVSRKFKKVFYLSGNHEFYGSFIDADKTVLESAFPDNFIHLHEASEVHDMGNDTIVIGGTLWTDMCNDDDSIKSIVGRSMNDFYYIRKTNIDSMLPAFDQVFTPSDAVEIFRRTFANIERTVKENADKKIVVVTHHAPSILGVSNRYGSTSNPINYGYFTALDSFIEEHPQIKYWVHGHTHCIHKKTIGNTVLLSNARGYDTEPGFDKFNMRKIFTV